MRTVSCAHSQWKKWMEVVQVAIDPSLPKFWMLDMAIDMVFF